ncbi:MAG TPA: glycine--tRNA ligase subunit beta, partial [Geothrix sp.]|nr:glycine--tRNA ligase subunit beta [Geothrix sp.]
MNTRDLLIELGTEELPPKALKTLSEAFLAGVRDGFQKAGVEFASIVPFATPRRLALLAKGVAERQPDKVVERRGPAVNAAFNEEGLPTKALQGFAASCGVTVEQLETVETDKGKWLVHRSNQPGRATAELIPDIVRG